MVTSAILMINSGALDDLKTTKTGEPPPLYAEIKTLDDAIVDLRSIGCSVIESVVFKTGNGEQPVLLGNYLEFRSHAYKKGTVFKITTMGETTLITTWNEKNYQWTPQGQVMILDANYDKLGLDNATCSRVTGGWQITLTYAKTGERGDSLYRVTVDGYEVQYPNYSANCVIANVVTTDIVYQGTYIDGVNTKKVNIWLSDRLGFKAERPALVSISSLGGFQYNKLVMLP